MHSAAFCAMKPVSVCTGLMLERRQRAVADLSEHLQSSSQSLVPSLCTFWHFPFFLGKKVDGTKWTSILSCLRVHVRSSTMKRRDMKCSHCCGSRVRSVLSQCRGSALRSVA